MRALFTIGYEGVSIEDFVKTLTEVGVTHVLDVRELPMSRRKGFSKTAFQAHLAAAEISYQHEKRLGSPTDIRNRLREDGDLTRYFRDFDKYLSKQTDLLDTLALSLKGKVALVCYERDPQECHRKSVAKALADRTKLQEKHLGVRVGSAQANANKTRLRTGQGLSAA